MQVSVVVPVYEQWNLVPELTGSFDLQTNHSSLELILVDNGSRDFPPLQGGRDNYALLECSKPGSYAARNKGLASAGGELILFTDADCVMDKNWVEGMVKAYQKSDKNTMFAGKVIIRSQSQKPSTPELYDIVAGLPQERYVSRGYAVTANLAVPKSVFENVGLFDESRFSGGDADFCQRALRAGLKLEYVPDAIVYHPARRSWREFATKVRRVKGGQIRSGKFSRRLKYSLITLIPPFWRLWRTAKSKKLTSIGKARVMLFQLSLWLVGLAEMFCLLLGKTPERR